MVFGERLLSIRKAKKSSQEELVKAIGVHAPVIGRYERGEVKPLIEVAIKLADALQMSVDYLVGNSDMELDKQTLNRMQQMAKMPDADRMQIFMVIDALIRDFNAKKQYAV
ncbi:helix-turn-helix domain-containing protein [Dyadobacter sandarakinus]|uniref:Helix-turn-helix transcriptional regulator n=1 Tax=Dyadobacter sandarakinus TaxID=2747268 RepID=A0ABX7I8E8_9BACT|nr:helix-turn-helix transcriptional regulator [Dyadobacter sandarakinus]QRR02374.1 helix-turn-helix transcriptional regulator [Dyadobacter sandarakinus]